MGTQPHTDDIHEPCDGCGRETPHLVTIQIRNENPKDEQTIYSREPYRVSECRVCGHEEVLRMNTT